MTRLTQRQLNRALLARQDLLERTPDWHAALHRHVALQAQEHIPPHTGLFARVSGYATDMLDGALARREVVRATSLRATIQLSTAADYLELQALMHPAFAANLEGFLQDREDHSEWLPVAREALSDGAHGKRDIARLLDAALPGHVDGTFMGHPVLPALGMVRVPRRPGGPHAGSRDLWSRGDLWLDTAFREAADVHDMVLRYLAAFGPASAQDMSVWAGIGGLAPVFADLRPVLTEHEGPDGRTLFDVPDAPMPDPDTPAPVRIMAAYDNALIGHLDRTRIMDADRRWATMTKWAIGIDSVLNDGRIAGYLTWSRTGVEVHLLDARRTYDLDALEGEVLALARTVRGIEDPAYAVVDAD